MKLICVLSVLLLLASSVEPAVSSSHRRYDSIFSFGDSFANTGNGLVVFAANLITNPSAQPPYGVAFPGHPTGRNSNGRLIIDFITEKLGLPYVPPFLTHNGSFRQGANFAVAGATTLDVGFFSDIPLISKIVLNTTSKFQLRWFESLKPSLCSPAQGNQSAQENKIVFYKDAVLHRGLQSARASSTSPLFFMGEFGVNDYSFSVFGKTLPQVRSIVPDVVRTISAATEELIKQGARTVVVPGVPPLGCTPPNLVFFPSADPAGYEPRTGCLKEFNEISVHHNSLLQEGLRDIQRDHPNVQVVYADFFTPVIEIVESPDKFGFTRDVLRCCCGGGGKYNFNMSAGCGMPGATVCENPSEHLFWDGHLTEAAHRYIAKGWLNSINDCEPY